MVRFSLVLYLSDLALDLHQSGTERRWFAAFELRDNRPIFLRRESQNFALTLHNHAQRYGLHAACGDSPPDLVPKQRADLITDKPVEYPSGLLRIHNVLIDAPGFFHGCPNRLRSDLVEENAEDLAFVVVENLFQVLADRFAFTIRVRSEKDALSPFCCRAEFLDNLFFSRNEFVDRLEIVFDIDAQLALRQILDVAKRSLHHEFLAEIFVYRVGFCRRFHNHQ